MGGDNSGQEINDKFPNSALENRAPGTLLEAATLDIPEANGKVYPEAEAAMALDSDLSLGINCCAVCGKPEEDMSNPVECKDCKSILYCCQEHRSIDVDAHQRCFPPSSFSAPHHQHNDVPHVAA